MGTCLGIEPAGAPQGVMRTWLGGTLQAANTFMELSYNNNPLAGEPAAAGGAAALNTFLLGTGGYIYVMGHSMGAQVIYKWLREYGPTSAVNPANVEFLTTGCPERKYGGAMRVPVTPRFLGRLVSPDYGGNGFPDASPYKVTDIARQYDFWADHPSAATVTLDAVNNATQAIHCNYNVVGLADSDLITLVTEGNHVYKLKRTYPPDAVAWLWWWPALQALLAASITAGVESSYSRPIALPW